MCCNYDVEDNQTQKVRQYSVPYTSKIIKAGALISDTKTLLTHWDVSASLDENINRVRRDNVFGRPPGLVSETF